MNKFRTILIAGTALIAAPALAQEAAPAAAPQTAAPAPSAAPAAAATAVTDAELKSFAKAALAVDKLNKDTSVPAADKNTKLAEAVTMAGLKPERFNEIATATSSDADLQKRVQAAVVAEQGATPAQGAASAPTR